MRKGTWAKLGWAAWATAAGVLVVSAARAEAQNLQAIGSGVQALTGPPGDIDSVLMLARDSSRLWMERLVPLAWKVFGSLAAMQLVYVLGKATFTGELANVADAVVTFMIEKGLWAFLLFNATTVLPMITFTFQQAGAMAAASVGGAVEPQALIHGVRELAKVQLSGLSAFNVLRGIEVLFSIAVVAAAYWLCAAFAWLGWFRSYVVMAVGSLTLGFGGWSKTEGIAWNSVLYAINAGIYLMVLELLKGLFFGYLNLWIEWAKADKMFGLETALVMVGSAVAIIVALISVPGFCAGIAHGQLSHAAEGLTMLAAVKASPLLGQGASKLKELLMETLGRSSDKNSDSKDGPRSEYGVSVGDGAATSAEPPRMNAEAGSPGSLSTGDSPPPGRGGDAGPSLLGDGGGGPSGGRGGNVGGRPRLGPGGGPGAPAFSPTLGRRGLGRGPRPHGPLLLGAGSNDAFVGELVDEEDVYLENQDDAHEVRHE